MKLDLVIMEEAALSRDPTKFRCVKNKLRTTAFDSVQREIASHPRERSLLQSHRDK